MNERLFVSTYRWQQLISKVRKEKPRAAVTWTGMRIFLKDLWSGTPFLFSFLYELEAVIFSSLFILWLPAPHILLFIILAHRSNTLAPSLDWIQHLPLLIRSTVFIIRDWLARWNGRWWKMLMSDSRSRQRLFNKSVNLFTVCGSHIRRRPFAAAWIPLQRWPVKRFNKRQDYTFHRLLLYVSTVSFLMWEQLNNIFSFHKLFSNRND